MELDTIAVGAEQIAEQIANVTTIGDEINIEGECDTDWLSDEQGAEKTETSIKEQPTDEFGDSAVEQPAVRIDSAIYEYNVPEDSVSEIKPEELYSEDAFTDANEQPAEQDSLKTVGNPVQIGKSNIDEINMAVQQPAKKWEHWVAGKLLVPRKTRSHKNIIPLIQCPWKNCR